MKVGGILIFVFLVVGVSHVAGNECNATRVNECYSSLVHYEGLGFPLYGEDEIELEEICRNINESFDCINTYVADCNNKAECDEECTEMIQDIGLFSINTGLRELQAELCDPLSAMRETYLENYVCLEDNADFYASCHNDSQRSQEFMATLNDPHEVIKSKCCFFSWYHDCFTNITRDTCGANATFFVSFSLHKLIGHLTTMVCQDSVITCSRPPLPQGDLDEDKIGQIDDDIDNSLDGGMLKDYSSPVSASVCSVLFPFLYFFTVKYIL